MNVLVTGGVGYIGSHTVVELLEAGDNVVIIDNLINSNEKILSKIEEITKIKPKFYNKDLRNKDDINYVLDREKIDAVIHFAALKAVGESVKEPLEYYENNIIGTINLLLAMEKRKIKNLIFSSSATVYGESDEMPLTEDSERKEATNPYGRSKSMTEDILMDLYKADSKWNIVLLRYFNPVGAHESGLIGELPNGVPNNIMPYIAKVAAGEFEEVNVFGGDYDTVDGTGVRDYIHVVDLAKGHIKALNLIRENCGLEILNLGTGRGYSVLELIKAFEKASCKEIKYKITDRRAGDVAVCYASPKKAEKVMGWTAERNIDDMCKDFWKWQIKGMKYFK